MTEGEWLICDRPKKMIGSLQGSATERKLQLFACACLRRIWQFLGTDLERDAILIAERFADNECDKTELVYASRDIEKEKKEYLSAISFIFAYGDAFRIAQSAEEMVYARPEFTRKESRIAHSTLIRCIFGNPFRQINTDPSWFTSTVIRFCRVRRRIKSASSPRYSRRISSARG